MRRIAVGSLFASLLVAGLVYAGCSKSAGSKEKPDEGLGGGGKVSVPGSKGGATTGGATEGAVVGGADDKRNRLSADEGAISIEAPAGAKAGAEVIAKVVVTPGAEYKVNTEFPTKLTLETPQGVTIAKAELKAGGQDQAKGDAEIFDENKLTFAVKLTPTASGSYTINGNFKFAVCDKAKTTCLAKKEPIAIQVAAQ
jgi:hypothetical protein